MGPLATPLSKNKCLSILSGGERAQSQVSHGGPTLVATVSRRKANSKSKNMGAAGAASDPAKKLISGDVSGSTIREPD
jgi:hypothetical protein